MKTQRAKKGVLVNILVISTCIVMKYPLLGVLHHSYFLTGVTFLQPNWRFLSLSVSNVLDGLAWFILYL